MMVEVIATDSALKSTSDHSTASASPIRQPVVRKKAVRSSRSLRTASSSAASWTIHATRSASVNARGSFVVDPSTRSTSRTGFATTTPYRTARPMIPETIFRQVRAVAGPHLGLQSHLVRARGGELVADHAVLVDHREEVVVRRRASLARRAALLLVMRRGDPGDPAEPVHTVLTDVDAVLTGQLVGEEPVARAWRRPHAGRRARR
jgi:hypothetical protein